MGKSENHSARKSEMTCLGELAVDVPQVAAEATKFQESLVDMLAQIGDVLPRFRIYEGLFKAHERLRRALLEAYLDVLQFCIATKDFFNRAKKSRSRLANSTIT